VLAFEADQEVPGPAMPRKHGPKLILSLTILIVAISGVSGCLNFRTQKKQLEGTLILGADQLSRSVTERLGMPCWTMTARPAFEIMPVIADKQGIDRIRMFNREAGWCSRRTHERTRCSQFVE
jgi:two-component system, NtrC family, sensor kinase